MRSHLSKAIKLIGQQYDFFDKKDEPVVKEKKKTIPKSAPYIESWGSIGLYTSIKVGIGNRRWEYQVPQTEKLIYMLEKGKLNNFPLFNKFIKINKIQR